MALKRNLVLIAFACLLSNSNAAQHNWALRAGAISFETGTHGEGQFLAIQNEWNNRSSTLFRSPDGVNWITCSLPQHGHLSQVLFGNGLFVAVDLDGTVFTSDNAVHWTTSSLDPVEALFFRNGTWIKHDKWTASYYASKDLANWTWIFGATSHAFGAAESGFVVSTQNQLQVSTNGFDWFHVGTLPIPSAWGVIEGNGTYLVQDNSGVYASNDGTNWVRSDLPAVSPILFGNGHFVSHRGPTWETGREVISSRDGITWNSARISGIDAIIFDGEKFYGLGSHMASSPDGSTWTRLGDIPPGTWIDHILPTESGLYALGGESAPMTLLHSTNGQAWKELFLPLDLARISGIASHGSITVAIGASGAIAVSSNNASWAVYHQNAAPLTQILYANGQWIVIGQIAPNAVVLTSIDARAWTETPLERAFSSIAFGNGRFVGVDGTAMIQTSDDGTHWHTNSTDQILQLSKVCFGNGIFLGHNPASSGLYRSVDGINWERLPNSPPYPFSAINFHDGKFALAIAHLVVTTTDGDSFETLELFDPISPFSPSSSAAHAGGNLAISHGGSLFRFHQTNGLTVQTECRPTFPRVQFCHDRFLAHSGVNIYSSRDGVHWGAARTPVPDEAPGYFSYGHGLWIFVSRGGFTAFSHDAQTWSPAAQDWNKTRYLGSFRSVSFGSDRFIAVGNAGIFATSTNGTSWSIGTPAVSWDLESVAYGNGKFVAVGNSDVALTSTNGRDWVSVAIGRSNANRVTSICFGNGKFVACTAGGEVLSSTTGAEWETKAVEPLYQLLAASPADDGFYFSGIGGSLYHSKDAREWVRILETKDPITSISFGNGNLLISDGTIRQRTPALQSTPAINGSSISLRAVVEPGRTHNLLSTANFGSWQTATNFTPASPRHDISFDAASTQHFFRLVAE